MTGFGKNILKFDSLTSTFDKLLEYTPDDNVVVVAGEQTAGVGRMGRQWLSNEGGLYFSFYVPPRGDVEEIPFTAIICALASYRTISSYTDCAVKWPNDIVARGRKVCGILTKSHIKSGEATIMAGVGINVNNICFDGELASRATSLKLLLGEVQDADEILNKFLSNFDDIYVNLTTDEIIDEYSKVCATVNSDVAVHFAKDGATVAGRCLRVCDDGSIDVETEQGIINVASGEVSVRGIYGYV